MDRFTKPETFMSLSVTEKLVDSLQVMFLGLTIVFLVLFILIFLIELMGKIFGPKTKPQNPAPIVHQQAKKPVENQELMAVISASVMAQEEELAAVIAAAISSESGIPTDQLRITSIRKIPATISAWQRAGIEHNMN